MAQPIDRPSDSATNAPEPLRLSAPQLAERYARVRAASLGLAQGLSEADANLQSMPDASPVKWHLAHTTWFFETFVLEAQEADFRPFDPSYRVLFNSYYNSVGEQYPRPDRGLISRPSLDEVRDYRAVIDRRVLSLLEAEDATANASAAAIVELGLHHEQQHQELILTDVKHALSKNPACPVFRKPEAPPHYTAGALRWQAFDEGLAQVGHAGRGFAFDNERPVHRVFLEAFEMASRTVSNGEWREFIDDGGYATPTLWLSDGWAWLGERGHRAPGYWMERDGAPQHFTLGGMQPVRDEDPVCHVSYYEADAFATWAGARLPREAEWEVAARSTAATDATANFVESGQLQPRALAPEAHGLEGMLGNVWEWTASPYVGYPRYRPAAGAMGEYNGKFMADQWVLRGGSCATPGSHIRPSYRNFFPASTRWQFAGLRLARDRG